MINFALILCLAPFLMQCAAEKDVRGLDLRLRNTDSKIEEIDNAVGAMENQRRTQAELGNQLEQIKSRLLQLDARVEEKNIQLKKLQGEQAALKQNTNTQLEQLRNQLTELNGKINGMNTQIASISGDFSRVQEDQAKEAAERAASAASAAKAAEEAHKKAEIAAGGPRTIEAEETKKKPGKQEEEAKPEEKSKAASAKTSMQEPETNTSDALYNKGLAAYKANKYKEAYNAFSTYLEKNKSAPLAPNARFWLGECLFQQKEFELAILEYQKVIADYPKTNKAPAALFKQGEAFEKLAEKDTAKIIYNKLLADYPKSDQAEMAKKRLKELK